MSLSKDLAFETWETTNPSGHRTDGRSNWATSPANHSRLMSDAMQAAPKPLSMLTTETFGEQVFNIPSNAATPPKDAP
jgi:hypothetical protein